MQIVTLACQDSDHTSQDTILNSLKCCSRTLRAACDRCRTSICIRSTHVKACSAQLGRLVSITHVVLLIGNGWSLGPDLLLLSRMIPTMISLTLQPIPGDFAMLNTRQVCDIARLLKPFRNSLQHLGLQDCDLLDSAASRETLSRFSTWNPLTWTECHVSTWWTLDFPKLKSLIIDDCKLECLDLSQCLQLQRLEVSGNRSLASLDLSTAKALRRFVCKDNPDLVELNLSNCLALEVLECHDNNSLNGLALPAKLGVQFLS